MTGHCTEEGHCLTNITIGQNSQECQTQDTRLFSIHITSQYLQSNFLTLFLIFREKIFRRDYEVILTEPSREVIPESDDGDNGNDDEDNVVTESTYQRLTQPDTERSDPAVEEDNTCRYKLLIDKKI